MGLVRIPHPVFGFEGDEMTFRKAGHEVGRGQ